MRIAAAQFASAWLDPAATLRKIVAILEQASREGVELVAFPESFLPGYPYWVLLGAAGRLGEADHAAAYARYLEAAVELGGRELAEVAQAAQDLRLHVFLGISERGARAGAGTMYCTLVKIDPEKGIVSAHRKLHPTHTERTVWARGDGHGLRVHQAGDLRAGGLSCWENWMPLARYALYADGEELHVATWPGSAAQNRDIPRLIALEGRVYVILASGLISAANVPADFPFYSLIQNKPAGFFNGGSSIVAPDGAWLVEPVVDEEKLLIADAEPSAIHAARHTLDTTGHYARPDVFHLSVDRTRHPAVKFSDGSPDDVAMETVK